MLLFTTAAMLLPFLQHWLLVVSMRAAVCVCVYVCVYLGLSTLLYFNAVALHVLLRLRAVALWPKVLLLS